MALDARVRIAWSTDPFSASPSWTDVSAYVDVGSHSIDITRGSGDLDETVNPSTLSLTFDNHDGRFTPGYTSGAYYPNVVLRKRIQVHWFDGSTYYPAFDGYIDTLPTQWAPIGKYAEAQVTAVDRLKNMGKQFALRNVVSQTYMIDAPLDYWTMGDPTNTTNPANLGTLGTVLSVVQGYGSDLVEYQSDQLLTTDGLLPVKLTTASLGGTGGTTAFSSGWTMECFVVTTRGVQCAPIFMADPTNLAYFLVQIDSTINGGAVTLSMNETAINFGVINATCTGSTNVADGRPHHIAAQYDPGTGGSISLYVDGVLEAGSGSIGATSVLSPYYVTRVGAVTVGAIRLSHVATYASVLSPTKVADHANSGLTGFAGETSAARFTRIAGYAGVTPVVTGTFGTQAMGPLGDIEGRSLLDMLQETQDVEQGAMFTQTDGDLQLLPRTAFFNAAAAMTLTNGQYDSDLTFVLDDTHLVNDASVTDGKGVVQRVQNTTSITANGYYSASKTLNTNNSNEALDWAEWQVGVASTLTPRCSQVTIDLLTQASLRVTAYGLEIGSRLDLSGLPSTAPASSVKLQIAGYSISYALTRFSMTANTIPFITTGLFTIANATLGKLNTGGILAF